MSKTTTLILAVSVLLGFCVGQPVWAAGGQWQVDSFFDVFAESGSTAGPPYPSDPPIKMSSSAEGMYLEEVKLCLGSVQNGSTTVPFKMLATNTLVAQNSGGGGGGGVTLEVYKLGGDFAVDSFFDITYQIDVAAPGTVITAVSQPSGDFAVDSFFDITYEIEFEGGRREIRGVRGLIQSGQTAVTRVSGTVVPSGDFAVDSFFDVFTELTIDGEVDPLQPVLYVQLNGGYTPEPATMSLLAVGLIALIRRRRK